MNIGYIISAGETVTVAEDGLLRCHVAQEVASAGGDAQ